MRRFSGRQVRRDKNLCIPTVEGFLKPILILSLSKDEYAPTYCVKEF
jgi:hypothetical protein